MAYAYILCVHTSVYIHTYNVFSYCCCYHIARAMITKPHRQGAYTAKYVHSHFEMLSIRNQGAGLGWFVMRAERENVSPGSVRSVHRPCSPHLSTSCFLCAASAPKFPLFKRTSAILDQSPPSISFHLDSLHKDPISYVRTLTYKFGKNTIQPITLML